MSTETNFSLQNRNFSDTSCMSQYMHLGVDLVTAPPDNIMYLSSQVSSALSIPFISGDVRAPKIKIASTVAQKRCILMSGAVHLIACLPCMSLTNLINLCLLTLLSYYAIKAFEFVGRGSQSSVTASPSQPRSYSPVCTYVRTYSVFLRLILQRNKQCLLFHSSE